MEDLFEPVQPNRKTFAAGPFGYPSHFIWWDLIKFAELSGASTSPAGLLVMEWSHEGPRSKALEDFLNVKASGKFIVKIEPIMSAQALERLRNSTLIRNVRVKTENPDVVRALEHDGKLAGMFVLGGVRGSLAEGHARPVRLACHIGEGQLPPSPVPPSEGPAWGKKGHRCHRRRYPSSRLLHPHPQHSLPGPGRGILRPP